MGELGDIKAGAVQNGNTAVQTWTYTRWRGWRCIKVFFCRVPVSRYFTILGQRHSFEVVGGALVALVLVLSL
jgi:hypothetical protein